MTTRLPAAGWYRDAAIPGQQRWWDGYAWTASTTPAPPPSQPQPPQPVQLDGCSLCGALPTAVVSFRSQTGVLSSYRERTQRGRWCRDCGLSVYRDLQDTTLTGGWWSVAGTYQTPLLLLRNRRERKPLIRLAAPTQRASGAPSSPALVARAGVYVALLYLALVLAFALLALHAWTS